LNRVLYIMTEKDYNKIVHSVKDKIFRFARSILYDTNEAEDITQDVFIKLWLNKNWTTKYKNIESFLMHLTKNQCLDKIKHRKVQINSMKDLKVLKNDFIDNNNEKKDTSDIIKEIIKKLPEKQKIIIHLRDVEGYEFEEISEITGVNLNALRVNLSRARKTVKEQLIKTMNYGL